MGNPECCVCGSNRRVRNWRAHWSRIERFKCVNCIESAKMDADEAHEYAQLRRVRIGRHPGYEKGRLTDDHRS